MPLKPAPASFFYKHAGWSHDPATETSEQGRQRCAQALAEAYNTARQDPGLAWRWEQESEPNEAFGIDHEGPLWCCVLVREADPWADVKEESLASCGGIDLGEEGHPESAPYARVIEAELAREALSA